LGRDSFLDADVLISRDLLVEAREYMRTTGARALLPHANLFHLDRQSSEVAVRQRLLSGSGEVDDEECHGYRLMTNRGGCIFVDAELFYALGGYDERYEGWGMRTTSSMSVSPLTRPSLSWPTTCTTLAR
jgi:predicted glycosyltransferase involved in capsule biosynthesis